MDKTDMERYNTAVSTAVENTMRKYTDNFLQELESMRGRLSRLESCVFTLNSSTEELKYAITNNHQKVNESLKFAGNHLKEAQRTVQVLRDKQEIYETQAELMKLQMTKPGDAVARNKGKSSTGVTQQLRASSFVEAAKPHHDATAPSAAIATELCTGSPMYYSAPVSQPHSSSPRYMQVSRPMASNFAQHPLATQDQPQIPESRPMLQPPLHFPQAQQSHPILMHPQPTHHQLGGQLMQMQLQYTGQNLPQISHGQHPGAQGQYQHISH